MTEDGFRSALIAFFAAQSSETAEEDADRAIRDLGEAMYRALDVQDLLDPNHLPAVEIARQQVLAAALARMPVPIPTKAEMAAQDKATTAAVRVRRNARPGVYTAASGMRPTEAEAAALLRLPAGPRRHEVSRIQDAFRRRVMAAAGNAEVVATVTMARNVLLSVLHDD